MEERKMYWGLDLGTNSVGWAVTDQNYQLMRAKGKDLWGARLFDRADTSAERRGYRVSRRRRQREVARCGVLKEYFYEEISKMDAGFFVRLEESKFWKEDRSEGNQQKYALFADANFTDKDFFEKYPTIFHLRKELLETSEAHDVRLVYLALLNMFKHRGHFLNTALSAEETETDMNAAYQELVDTAGYFDIAFDPQLDAREIENILGEKGISRSRILEKLSTYMGISKSDKAAYELLKLVCGNAGKLVNIYGSEILGEENKTLSISFRDSNYEEKETQVKELVGDDYFELLLAAKAVHDIGLLANILKGHAYLTYARVESYEEHKKDLQLLKCVLKKYNPEGYDKMFRVMEPGNYSAYIGSVNSKESGKVRRNEGKGRSREDLYKTIRKLLGQCPQDDQDVALILSKIESEAFLPKQLTADNGVIPNQVYVKEMRKILKNAATYLPFLKEKDESQLTVAERIIQLFSFQIPYYIGPLGQEHLDEKGYNEWARRIAPGKVYPWNLEEKFDTKEAAEKFIERMVRHCSYLTQEKTLPKNSLLYEKFMVLNELNNLKIHGEKITVEQKQDLYNSLFIKGKRVSIAQIVRHCQLSGWVEKDDTDFLSGIDLTGFKASLSSVGKFRGVFGEGFFNDKQTAMAEQIIFWATVYGNDKSYLRERIEEEYSELLDEKQIKRILGFKFEGWGNLSREFLYLRGTSRQDSERSVIMTLWETNDNLMELLSERYTYKEALQEQIKEKEKTLEEWTIEDLGGMYLSAPVKRMLWQTMKILLELKQTLGQTPDRVYVEMPREDGEKGERKDSRKKKLLDLYSALKGEEKAWRKEIEDRPEADFRIKKLYLYYRQMGKCMYTGETIELADLFNDNLYDIDHIYPRHFVKDDSIENNLILVKKQKNARKGDSYPIEREIQRARYQLWKMLADKNFISREKHQRLIRTTPFSEEEKAGFISRQLVETRQGTKAITKILRQIFPDTMVVFSKAGEVSAFRHKFNLEKVRCLNDFHHAQDAYLNIVVGNAYYVKFTANPINFIREAEKNPQKDLYKYHMDKFFEYTVQRGDETAWIGTKDEKNSTIHIVKKVMARNTPLITKRCYAVHGGITRKDTIYNKETAKGQGYIAVKGSDPRLCDVTKYGGRTSINNMFYTLASYRVKGKSVLSLEAIPGYLGNAENISDETLLRYLQDSLEKENPGKVISDLQIKYRCIRYKSLLKIDGFYYYIAGKTGKQICLESAVPLILNNEDAIYLKKIEKAVSGQYFEEKREGQLIITEECNQKLYDILLEKLTDGIYRNKKASLQTILQEGREKFIRLSIPNQCQILMNLVGWFQLSCVTADMKEIGGSVNSGKCLMGKKISDCSEMILITQSATGLQERCIDLLKL